MSDTWESIFQRNITASKQRDSSSFETMFEYLSEIKHPTIVETGTYREENNYEGDGCSTLLFDKYIECHGGNLLSIDNDPKACQLARNATTEALVIERDSVEALGEMEGRVDLLYLDSYNIEDWNNDWAPAAHHLKELCAAKNVVRPGTLIVVDDNIQTRSGDLNRQGAPRPRTNGIPWYRTLHLWLPTRLDLGRTLGITTTIT
jgi:predicted O-methyltransferase YrrM